MRSPNNAVDDVINFSVRPAYSVGYRCQRFFRGEPRVSHQRGDVKFSLFEHIQKIPGQVKVTFVDLVDEHGARPVPQGQSRT